MHIPAARAPRPQASPAERWAYPAKSLYPSELTATCNLPVKKRLLVLRSHSVCKPWPGCADRFSRCSAQIASRTERRTARGDDHGNNQAVDTKNTRHNYRHDRLHHEFRPEDTHRGDADARLGGTIGRPKACKLTGTVKITLDTLVKVCHEYAGSRRCIHAKISALAAPMNPKKGAVSDEAPSVAVASAP
jgi:hypothetical protein